MVERRTATHAVGNPTHDEYSDYGSINDDHGFRTQILRSALKRLPTAIYINEHVNGYSIRDGSGMMVWADDLPSGGSEELIYDLARLFRPEDQRALTDAFHAKHQLLMNHLRNEPVLRDRFNLCCGLRLNQGDRVSVSILSGLSSGGKIYALSIEKVYDNTMMLGRRR